MELYMFVFWSFMYILPAYIANSTPALFGGLYKNAVPIDMGKKYKDGRRMLGDGKTFRGLFLGIFFGTVTGTLTGIYFGSVFEMTIIGLLLSCGAMAGDLAGSFFKRRLGLERGRPLPVIDQVNFLIGAFAFASLVAPASLETVAFLLIITPLIHLFVNAVGYLLHLKKVPW